MYVIISWTMVSGDMTSIDAGPLSSSGCAYGDGPKVIERAQNSGVVPAYKTKEAPIRELVRERGTSLNSTTARLLI